MTVLALTPVPERIEPELLNLLDIMIVNEVEVGALPLPLGQHSGHPERAAEAFLPRVGRAVLLTWALVVPFFTKRTIIPLGSQRSRRLS